VSEVAHRHPRTASLRHHLPAVHPGPEAEVDHPVGGANGLFVVLDHQDRVPQVAHPLQRSEQAGVVPLMEPDRRLVEDVEHAHQLAADLGGQPDALALAAGEGPRGAVEVR
jgi:hypothetical protein